MKCGVPSPRPMNFNPRHHAGGDMFNIASSLPPTVFQSTPPRRWRLRMGAMADGRDHISIHATTQVATIFMIGYFIWDKFQSTPPRRWRRRLSKLQEAQIKFQSTPPRRWRLCAQCHYDEHHRFQSTPPRRWRLTFSRDSLCLWNFNPRHHAGGDSFVRDGPGGDKPFQSTPPRRWRLYYGYKKQGGKEFQSTPPRRWRLCATVANSGKGLDFNPRHHAGGDLQQLGQYIRRTAISIHATTQVATNGFG